MMAKAKPIPRNKLPADFSTVAELSRTPNFPCKPVRRETGLHPSLLSRTETVGRPDFQQIDANDIKSGTSYRFLGTKVRLEGRITEIRDGRRELVSRARKRASSPILLRRHAYRFRTRRLGQKGPEGR